MLVEPLVREYLELKVEKVVRVGEFCLAGLGQLQLVQILRISSSDTGKINTNTRPYKRELIASKILSDDKRHLEKKIAFLWL